MSLLNRSPRARATVAVIASLVAACTVAPPTTAPSAPGGPVTSAIPTAAVGGASPSLRPTARVSAFTATFEPTTLAPADAIAIEMAPGGRPAFTPAAVSAKPGSIALHLKNVDPVAGGLHDFRIGPERGLVGASIRALRPGEAGVLTLADLAPGTYTFWCEILRHWEFGMVGTLTVAP